MSERTELLAEIERVHVELEDHREMVEQLESELARLTARLDNMEEDPDYLV
jgi:predicted nuclease with TOPRIM domain